MSEACTGSRVAVGSAADATTVLRALADGWNDRGIGYAVANGLEGFPEARGRDLDVVVAPPQLREASDITIATLLRYGRQPVVRRRRELIQHIGFCPAGGEAVIVDLFPGLRWGPSRLVECPDPSGFVDRFAVDPWASFVKRILLHVLVGPTAKFSRAPERLHLDDAECAAASRRLSALVGEGLTIRTLVAVDRGDVGALERLRPRLRLALIRRTFLRRPLAAITGSGEWLSGRVSLLRCSPAMPTVSVVGPDGVGKTTVIAEIARTAKTRLRCTRVEYRHWRPGVLPQLGSFVGKAPPAGGTPPRRTAGRFGWLRTLYYGLDFVLGARLRDRRVSRNLGLVIYDRGALDMYVDPLRYGLRPDLPLRRLLRFLPRPGLIVLLRDDPARIRERKPELEQAEITRQLDVWQALAAAGDVDMVLDVDDPAMMAERVVDRVAEVVRARNASASR